MSFSQPEDVDNNLPIRMECTIYRSDRSTPITIREYMSEVKQESALWQELPRRMLRIKTISQCDRLAFGFHDFHEGQVLRKNAKELTNSHHKKDKLSEKISSKTNVSCYTTKASELKAILKNQ